MFPTRKMLFHFYQSATGDGADLPGGEDYGNDFIPDGADKADEASADDKSDKQGEETQSATEGKDKDGGPTNGNESLRDAAGEANEGDDKAAKDTGTPKTGKAKFIPLDRHEKLLRKERERREQLEAQLSQNQSGKEMAKANEELTKIEDELVEMERQYNDLLSEGDTAGAAKLMTQIRRKNTELTSVANEQRDARIMAQAVEQVRYEEALERIEDQFPELRPDSDEFDEDRYQDVIDLMRAGQRRGMSATKSLQRAVARVMGAETAAQKRATTVEPRVTEKDVAEQRRTEALKRNLDVAGKQPAPTHKAGFGNDVAGGALTAKAVMNMSDDAFDKLTEAQLSALRGDKV